MDRQRTRFRPLRCLIQLAALALFVRLLVLAARPGSTGLPDADVFLHLDPLAGPLAALAGRELFAGLGGSVLVLVSALLFGRVFCGWLCPMGTVLEYAGRFVRFLARKPGLSRHRPARGEVQSGRMLPALALLVVVAVAALLGANLFFWLSPIPLVTRLWVVCLLPLAATLGNLGLDAGSVLLEALGEGALYWHFEVPVPDTVLFVALFWLVLLGLELASPRFWCRYLCPAGALLGLLARLAPQGRRVASTCTHCGRCARTCPVDILAAPSAEQPQHCLGCRSCQDVCPQTAVHFGLRPQPEREAAAGSGTPALSRRTFVGTALSASAGLALTHVPGVVRSPGAAACAQAFVRPPGALPEERFLALCLRCSACTQVCPTGGLQPLGLAGGMDGFFSPVLAARRGACVVECTRCGAVCPTGAIRDLAPAEKRWAKMGTAALNARTCLALAEDKRCMVCKENCPYGAIDVVVQEGHAVPVPVVHEKRCYGCGFCEKACPKEPAAIVVTAAGALRLEHGNYEGEAARLGLELDPQVHRGQSPGAESAVPPDGPPPGFLE